MGRYPDFNLVWDATLGTVCCNLVRCAVHDGTLYGAVRDGMGRDNTVQYDSVADGYGMGKWYNRMRWTCLGRYITIRYGVRCRTGRDCGRCATLGLTYCTGREGYGVWRDNTIAWDGPRQCGAGRDGLLQCGTVRDRKGVTIRWCERGYNVE